MRQLLITFFSFMRVARLIKNRVSSSSSSTKTTSRPSRLAKAKRSATSTPKATAQMPGRATIAVNRSKGMRSMKLGVMVSLPSRCPAALIKNTNSRMDRISAARAMPISS